MKITPKILHIPPYLSTTWMNIRSLYVKENDLIVCLADGASICIPGLTPELIEAIFTAHAAFLEGLSRLSNPPERQPPFQLFQITGSGEKAGENTPSLRFNLDSLDSFSSAMQHNPAQANIPDLPKEIINKIAEIAKIVAPDDIQSMPKPEPQCNCPYCQIARAVLGHVSLPIENEPAKIVHEEVVSEHELNFQQWDIFQTGDKLYSVVNRLDSHEKYSVFLGNPVGCTCGKQGCEHILAVLKS